MTADSRDGEPNAKGEAPPDQSTPVEPEVVSPAGGLTEEALRRLGRLLPGLDGLLDALSRSPAFRERLAEADARIEERLQGGGHRRQ